MVTKQFNNFSEMIDELRRISYSLNQSFGDAEITTPEQLHQVYIENQKFYRNEHNISIREYFTGGGTGFDYTVNADDTVDCTIYHTSGWHENSTLLAEAWLAGFRGGVSFNYSNAQAVYVQSAYWLQRGLRMLNISGDITFDECVTAAKTNTKLELVARAISEAQARKVARANENKEDVYIYEYDDDDDDDTGLIGENTLKLMRETNMNFDED